MPIPSGVIARGYDIRSRSRRSAAAVPHGTDAAQPFRRTTATSPIVTPCAATRSHFSSTRSGALRPTTCPGRCAPSPTPATERSRSPACHRRRPTELARLLEENGLQRDRVARGHASVSAPTPRPSPTGSTALGCPRVIVPSLPEADRRTADDVRRFAAELGAFAETFAERGIRLGYHNHSFEFEDARRRPPLWETLLDELPSEVEIELDVLLGVGRRPRSGVRDPRDGRSGPAPSPEGPSGRRRGS